MDSGDEVFVAQRDRLMGVAYRVLGRVTDAEDVVQDAWLRWTKVDDAQVADPEGYLVTVTTRLAIDRLRRVQARRESYVGEWLPEPLLTADAVADVADDVVRNESVSLALLVVLETLSPLERAAFVLHEIFERLPYGRLAAVLDRNEAAVRQLVSRARTRVRERHRRFDVEPDVWRKATDQFFAACLTGDLAAVMELLAPDVRLIADGGGLAMAPRRVVTGPEPVARFLLHVMHLRPSFLSSVDVDPAAPIDIQLVTANGGPALVIAAGGRTIVHFQLQVAGGQVTACYLVVNPEKLSGLVSQDGWVLRP